ncbi:MAG: hypothetical protein CMJ78_14480 [Planctomycetaceae bacterium]|nr:hypothetical protein [Planctomycetaceae bacterium]
MNVKAPTARAEPEKLDNTYFTDEELNWWSFRAIRRPPLPLVDADIESPIDAFLLAKILELKSQYPNNANAFRFSGVADRKTLIRRLYLDMLGVPPTPEAIQDFVHDKRLDAWPQLIDRVLASPQYGERWGRHWLDAAGYADSEGYTDEDRVREHAWRYRDYVIRAFNQDKPYTEFLTEQLAGDELVGWPGAQLRPEIVHTLAATGFLRMAPDGTASGGIDQNLARNQVVADTLQIVGTAVLGMSIHCAQCHDHRYDPIPQRDYYQFRAIFEPALDWKNWRTPSGRLVSLYSDTDKQKRNQVENKAKQVDTKRQERIDFYITKTLEHELLMVADELQEPLRTAYRTPAAKRSAEQKKLLEGHINIARLTAGSLYLYDRRRDARAKDLDVRRSEKQTAFLQRVKNDAIAKLDKPTRKQVLDATNTEAAKRSEAQQKLLQAHPAVGVTADSLAKFDEAAAAELKRYETAAAEIREYRIRSELDKLADEAKQIREDIPKEHFLRMLSEQPSKVPATYVFNRGDHGQPLEEVKPRGLSVLDAPPVEAVDSVKTTGRRLQFARYLTSGKHPLTARVLVNRIWAHHFGRGIVLTTGDFGYLGDKPTHAELLEWLAAEFMHSGWSIKHVHRLILTSRTYQQSTNAAPAMVAADPDNQLLGRWPLRRLESETLRDAILATVGKLNPSMFGEPVPVMEDEVGQIVLGKENLDGERKPTNPIALLGEEFRRSVYIQVRRSRPLGVLESFDLPDLAPNCTERPSSNVAPQSLMLMNSDFLIKMSESMSERLMAERPDNIVEQLRRGWQLSFGSIPSEAQLANAEAFFVKQNKTFTDAKSQNAHRAALATYCQALLGSNGFVYIE